MKARVQKWGNSLALRLPRPFAGELGWGENAPVEMSLEENALVVRSDRERAWDLEDLLERVADDNVHPAWESERAGAARPPRGDGEAG